MAVCMANGGGGTVVLGVRDKPIGREAAISGVSPEVDINRLKKAVYDSTDPKLTPVFEELRVTEGTGRLIVMQIYPGLPPYTDTAGKGKIRIGQDCQPLTGTLRRHIMVETGESDFSAVEVQEDLASLLSPTALEQLRVAAQRERAPEDLLKLSDLDLLSALGVVRNGHFTRAGILLVGKESALRTHVPGYVWTHLRMQNDTQYSDRMDGWDAHPVAVARITDRIMANNPITTVEAGSYHFEYRTYPEIALREALMNAFCHAEYRIAGPILVKQFPQKIEMSNPGGLIGGISPNNILHHEPVARNAQLVEALTRLRLINRSNLGVTRIFSSLLIEGKEPPLIEDQGEAVKVTFLARELSASFRLFVAEESQNNRQLSVDHLLVLQYLLHRPEIDTAVAAHLCQRSEEEVHEVLSEMEQRFGYLTRSEVRKSASWTLTPDYYARLSAPDSDHYQRIDWETAKTQILSILKQRAAEGEKGLSNAEIRQITHLTRDQVVRLMRQLRTQYPQITEPGQGRHARYEYLVNKASS